MKPSVFTLTVQCALIVAFTACSGGTKPPSGNQPESELVEPEPVRPNGYSPERGYYHSDTDCGEIYAKMLENAGKAEALRYMTTDCCGNPEYHESILEVLGITMRSDAAACLAYVENELIGKQGNKSQAIILREWMLDIVIESPQELAELEASLSKARKGELKAYLEANLLPSLRAKFPSSLADIDVSSYTLIDKQRTTHKGVIRGVAVETLEGMELLVLTIEGNLPNGGKLWIHNDCKVLPEIESDGLKFMQERVGIPVWIQLEPIKSPSGKEYLLITDLVVAQRDRFDHLGFDNEGNIYETIGQMIELVRKGNTKMLADIISYPITITYNDMEVTLLNRQDALKAIDVIFNGRVKSAILNQSLAELHVNQYGIMIGEGELWLTTASETNDELRIYRMNAF